MTPQEVLDRAMQMLTAPEFGPAIAQAFESAEDIPTAAAALVGPIIIRVMQEFDIEDDEIFGNDGGDGIATYLIGELFDLAGESGYLPEEGSEEEALAMGEKAAQILERIIDGANAAAATGAAVQQPQQAGLLGA